MMAAARMAEQVRSLFDAKAASWPGKYSPDGPLAGRLRQFSEAVMGRVPPGGVLLDLGCGTGEVARDLAAAGYRVTGCDIAPRMLTAAAAADHGHAVGWILLAPRWRTLPFAAGSLDAVVAASVLEYVPDLPAVLHECARVLRPGGILLCTVPDVAHPVRWLEWPLALAARTPLAPVAGLAWPRLRPYLAYLRASRQRRPLPWWRAVGRTAGLRLTAPLANRAPLANGASRAPLRMLAFTRPGTFPGDS